MDPGPAFHLQQQQRMQEQAYVEELERRRRARLVLVLADGSDAVSWAELPDRQ